MKLFRILSVIATLAVVSCSTRQPAADHSQQSNSNTELPGRKADGSILLPNQWSLRSVGRQIELGDFPSSMAVHPNGRYVAILHCGVSQHEIKVVDLITGKITSNAKFLEGFYGIAFTRDGKQLYCSGAATEVIRCFGFKNGILGQEQQIPLRASKDRGVPCGIAIADRAKRLYAANVWGQSVSVVNLAHHALLSDIDFGGKGAAPSARAKQTGKFDLDALTKRNEADLDTTSADAPFPYGCCVDEKRQRLYVTLWNQSSVAVLDTRSNQIVNRIPTQQHPCELVLSHSGKYLFVANANQNSVTIINTEDQRVIETLTCSLYPDVPPGSTPNSVALSPNDSLLFVANADNNNVAVFDVTSPGKSRSLGFIPVGWYPTSVRLTPDGKQLLVLNGKGLSSRANPDGPQPGKKSKTKKSVEYIARLFKGTLTIIDLPDRNEFEEEMKQYTADAYRCSPLHADASTTDVHPKSNPIPDHPGGSSPIKYCIYIVKENRTYDQVLGDMPEGNGDPKLCLFPERVTPNLHKLAREFVLLDNFYVDAEVSADGHEWSMGAYATDFVEKTWPLTYGHNIHKKYPFPAEGTFPIARPYNGYLWDRAKEAGVSYRSYGEFIACSPSPDKPNRARVKSLEDHFDPWYRPFDIDYPDVKRADRFISELHRFEHEGDMPQLQIIRLPNDHTRGSLFGKKTPAAYVADNDLALGKMVEALSRSKFWSQTAVFVVEDDAQNGPDHVDAHRTTAFVISPYVKHGAVDSTMYSTSSMLRTIELILGMKPMSQFDAAARPMYNAFQNTVDTKGYVMNDSMFDLQQTNPKDAWGSKVSAKLDFSKEDAVDDLLLSEIVWRSVRGNNSPAPSPVHAAFVFAHEKDDD